MRRSGKFLVHLLSQSRSRSVCALLVLFLVCHTAPLSAQSVKSYLPVLGGTDADLGLAFVNPTLVDGAVTFTLHGYDGSLLQGADIVNPASLPLPASRQKALMAAEIFGQGISGKRGWIELTLSAPTIRGFFLLFDSQLNFVDGTDLIFNTARQLFFPNVSPSTILSFVHTGIGELSVSVALYANDGHLVRRQDLNMAPLSGFSGSLDALIPGIAGFEGYVVVDSNTPFLSSLAGIESFRSKSDIAVVKAQQRSDQLRIGYIAHLATQGQYTSTLTLVNPDPLPQKVLITAADLQVGGQPRMPWSQTIERVIPPYGRLAESVDTLFAFTTQPLMTGYLHYEVSTDTEGLLGSLAYGTIDGTALAAVPAQGNGYSDLFFAHVAQGLDFYTGLAMLNPNTDPVVVGFSTFDRDGKKTGAKLFTLNAGERRARVFSELLDNFAQVGGYVRLSSTRPIFTYELFGSQSSQRFLANVPAQGVSLKQQYSGAVVTAAGGAQVLSSDGMTSLVVPPGALPADAVVEVATLSTENLPEIPAGQFLTANDLTQAGLNQVPIGNVQLKPIGTQLQAPPFVMFPIRVQLKPGAQIPVFTYNTSTQQYARTDLFAYADESGRTVSAEIREFGTYVVGLPRDQIQSTIALNPKSGVTGTIVSLSGDGFSANPTEDLVTFAGSTSPSVAAKIIAASPTLLTVVVPEGAATGTVMVRTGTQTWFGAPFTIETNPPPPSGPTFYVSPTGNDANAGILASPWKTIQKAADTMNAGSTVIVQAGTYDERINVTRSGSSSNLIVFQAQGTVKTQGFNIHADYVKVDGFEIVSTGADPNDRSHGSGIYLSGGNNQISNNYIHNTSAAGIFFMSTVSNTTVSGNRVAYAVECGIFIDGTNNLVVSNDVSHSVDVAASDADGIRFFGSGNTVRQNHIHDLMVSDSPGQEPHIDAFQTWGPATNYIFERNWIDKSADGHHQGWTIESIPSGSPVDNIIIRNNVVITRGTGYQPAVNIASDNASGIVSNIYILNNTITALNPLVGFAIWLLKNTRNAVIKNNIIDGHGNAGEPYLKVQAGAIYQIAKNAVSSPGLGGLLIGDIPWPSAGQFVDWNSLDFHLLANATLKGAGEALALAINDFDGKPRNSPPSIGAYE